MVDLSKGDVKGMGHLLTSCPGWTRSSANQCQVLQTHKPPPCSIVKHTEVSVSSWDTQDGLCTLLLPASMTQGRSISYVSTPAMRQVTPDFSEVHKLQLKCKQQGMKSNRGEMKLLWATKTCCKRRE